MDGSTRAAEVPEVRPVFWWSRRRREATRPIPPASPKKRDEGGRPHLRVVAQQLSAAGTPCDAAKVKVKVKVLAVPAVQQHAGPLVLESDFEPGDGRDQRRALIALGWAGRPITT